MMRLGEWVRVKIAFYFGYGDNFGLVKKVAVAKLSTKRYDNNDERDEKIKEEW